MTKIFSGDYSKEMWKEINEARSKKELRYALYFVCCKLQELEAKYDNLLSNTTDPQPAPPAEPAPALYFNCPACNRMIPAEAGRCRHCEVEQEAGQ